MVMGHWCITPTKIPVTPLKNSHDHGKNNQISSCISYWKKKHGHLLTNQLYFFQVVYYIWGRYNLIRLHPTSNKIPSFLFETKRLDPSFHQIETRFPCHFSNRLGDVGRIMKFGGSRFTSKKVAACCSIFVYTTGQLWATYYVNP